VGGLWWLQVFVGRSPLEMMICSPSNDIKWTEENQLLGVSNCF